MYSLFLSFTPVKFNSFPLLFISLLLSHFLSLPLCLYVCVSLSLLTCIFFTFSVSIAHKHFLSLPPPSLYHTFSFSFLLLSITLSLSLYLSPTFSFSLTFSPTFSKVKSQSRLTDLRNFFWKGFVKKYFDRPVGSFTHGQYYKTFYSRNVFRIVISWSVC
jgi:hypothetical protein